MKKNALIIGSGVSGLTTALCLQAKGINSIIVAEKCAPDITSVVAGALWEWPPAVCGYHHDQISLKRSKYWCMTSFRKFEELANNPNTGVNIRPVTFYFRNKIEKHQLHLTKMNEISACVPGFRRGVDLIYQNGINPNIGLIDAYSHLAPMVDTDVYMAWLKNQVQAGGTQIIIKKIEGNLRVNEHGLKKEYGADVIINCAGLGSRELADETVFPLRGALIRLVNNGMKMPILTEAHCISHDHVTSEKEIVFIVPRGKDRIVLGAIAEKNQWTTDIGLDNYKPIQKIYGRCVEFLPALKHAQIDPIEPVRVGLRPFRKGNVRVEEESGSSIVHNYGHGGAGVTFSWGCGAEVAERVSRLLLSRDTQFENQSHESVFENMLI